MINKLQLNIKRDKQLARFYADEKIYDKWVHGEKLTAKEKIRLKTVKNNKVHELEYYHSLNKHNN